VVECGAITSFLHLLHSSNSDCVEQAAKSLGNIAGKCIEFRDHVWNSGIVNHFLELFEVNLLLLKNRLKSMNNCYRVTLLRNVVKCISNICRGDPLPSLQNIQPLFPFISQWFQMSDQSILADALFAFSYLSDGEEEYAQAIYETGIVPRVMSLLQNESDVKIVTSSILIIGNICVNEIHQRQLVIEEGGPGIFYRLLDFPTKNIQKYTCWTIANLSAGTSQQIQC
jgi:hypothetical protein